MTEKKNTNEIIQKERRALADSYNFVTFIQQIIAFSYGTFNFPG